MMTELIEVQYKAASPVHHMIPFTRPEAHAVTQQNAPPPPKTRFLTVYTNYPASGQVQVETLESAP